jgi:hypothetical protein
MPQTQREHYFEIIQLISRILECETLDGMRRECRRIEREYLERMDCKY